MASFSGGPGMESRWSAQDIVVDTFKEQCFLALGLFLPPQRPRLLKNAASFSHTLYLIEQ